MLCAALKCFRTRLPHGPQSLRASGEAGFRAFNV